MHHKTVIAIAAAAALSACAGLNGTGSHDTTRIPANPPGFATAPPSDINARKMAEFEREAMRSTIDTLKAEIADLKQLFKLRTTPLDEPSKSADAFASLREPVKTAAAAAPAAQPVKLQAIPAATPLAVQPAPPTAASEPAQPATTTYTTLFRFASASLDDSAKAALSALRPQLLNAQAVRLNAFADSMGNAAINARLADARAAAVAAELVALGVPRARINVSAAVTDTAPPAHAGILGLFRDAESMGRRVDVALLSTKN